MNITISEHVIRIVTVALDGRLDAFNASELRECFERLLSEGVNRFVVDLTALSFLDSAGMAVLVTLLKRARGADGNVVLILPREESAKRILRLTRFDRVFPLAETREAAVGTF